ncbi:MAG: hypothetical protein M1582_04070, partial [Actinobacteria bacterium]|nr:hypothetical protein [Actinomycetota bacterium]
MDVLKPYVMRLAWANYSPRQWRRRLLPSFADLSRLAVNLPRRSERLLTQLERGNISINIHVHDTERVLSELHWMVSRLIIGMVVSGFSVATGLLMLVYFTSGQNVLVGWLLGIGMAIVAAGGAWLVFSIHRCHRRDALSDNPDGTDSEKSQ